MSTDFLTFSTKESWLVHGLYEFYAHSGSPRCLELLLNVREPHERFLCDKMAEGIKSNQGTIHILHKHLYITKLNLSSKIFTKNVFFCQYKRGFFQCYILTKFSYCSLKFSVPKEKEKYSKNS